MGSGPCRRQDFFVVYPETASAIVPCALLRREVHFGAAVVLGFGPHAHFLVFRRVHPSVGIGGVVFLRVLVEGRDAGWQSAPYVTEVDAGTDGRLHAILLALVFVGILQALFRREYLGHVATVREGIGDVPLHVGLLYIAERVALEILVLVPQHALLELGKVLVRIGLLVPHHGTFAIEVLVTATQPSAFGQGQHAWVEVVFEHHVFFRREETVVPEGDDGSHYIVSLMWLVVHVAIVECHEVGKGIEVVGVVETAVDVRDARRNLSVEAPHLHHVDFARLVLPARIPRNHLLALGANIRYHFRHEGLVREAHLVCTDVQVRHVGKGFAYLVDEELQNLGTFGALHVVAEGAHEGCAMARHVDFGDEEHVVLLTELHEFLGFFDGVVLALQAGHVHTIVQHREYLAFQAPCLVLGEVPMEHVDLVSGEDFDFLLQLVEREVAAADVVHETTDLEGWPVDNLACLVRTLLLLQLAEGLQCPVHALLGSGFYLDALG